MGDWDRHVHTTVYKMGFPGCDSGKEPDYQIRRHETRVRSLGQEDPLEEGTATYSSMLAWRISWTEEPGGLQPIGLQSIGTSETT